MSWAAHNPEGYEECLRNGVAARLRFRLKDNGFTDIDNDTIDAIVAVLQSDEPKAFESLVAVSMREVSDAESNYLMGSCA